MQQMHAMHNQIQRSNDQMAALRYDLTKERGERGKSSDMNNRLSQQNEEISRQLMAMREEVDRCRRAAAQNKAAAAQNKAAAAVQGKLTTAELAIKELQSTNAALKKEVQTLQQRAHKQKQKTPDPRIRELQAEVDTVKKQLALTVGRCRKLTSEKDAAQQAAQQAQRAAQRAAQQAEKDEATRAALQEAANAQRVEQAKRIADLEAELLKKTTPSSQEQQSGRSKKSLQRTVAKLQQELSKVTDSNRSLRRERDKFKTAEATIRAAFDKVKAAFAKKETAFAKKEAAFVDEIAEVRGLINAAEALPPAKDGASTACTDNTPPAAGSVLPRADNTHAAARKKKKKKKKKKGKKGGDGGGGGEGEATGALFVPAETLLQEARKSLEDKDAELEKLRATRASHDVAVLAKETVDALLNAKGIAQLVEENKTLTRARARMQEQLNNSELQLAKRSASLAEATSRLAAASEVFVSVEQTIAAEQIAHQQETGEENDVYTTLLCRLADFLLCENAFEIEDGGEDDDKIDAAANWKIAAACHQSAAQRHAMMTMHYMATIEARLGRPAYSAKWTTPYEVMDGAVQLVGEQHGVLLDVAKMFTKCCMKMYPSLGAVMTALHARVGDGTIASTLHWMTTSMVLLNTVCRRLEVTKAPHDVPIVLKPTGNDACASSDMAETVYQLQTINKFQQEELKRRSAALADLEQQNQDLRLRAARDTDGDTGEGVTRPLDTVPHMNVAAISMSRAMALVQSAFNSLRLGGNVFKSAFNENITPVMYATWLFEKVREGLELVTGHCRHLMLQSDKAARALGLMTQQRNEARTESGCLKQVFGAAGFQYQSVEGLRKQLGEFQALHTVHEKNEQLRRVNTDALAKLKEARVAQASVREELQTVRAQLSEYEEELTWTSAANEVRLQTSVERFLDTGGQTVQQLRREVALLKEETAPRSDCKGGGSMARRVANLRQKNRELEAENRRLTDQLVKIVSDTASAGNSNPAMELQLLKREQDLKTARIEVVQQARVTNKAKTELVALRSECAAIQSMEREEQECAAKARQHADDMAEELCRTRSCVDRAMYDAASSMQRHKENYEADLARAQQERDRAQQELTELQERNATKQKKQADAEFWAESSLDWSTPVVFCEEGAAAEQGASAITTPLPSSSKNKKTGAVDSPKTREKKKLHGASQISPQSVMAVVNCAAATTATATLTAV